MVNSYGTVTYSRRQIIVHTKRSKEELFYLPAAVEVLREKQIFSLVLLEKRAFHVRIVPCIYRLPSVVHGLQKHSLNYL